MSSVVSHRRVLQYFGWLLGSTLAFAVPAATWTVTNTSDSGAGSLRQTILDAAGGDTIVFAPGTNGIPITLTSGQLTLDKHLTITGNGPALTQISGNNTSRVLSVTSGITVTLDALTVANGRSNNIGGGGLFNDGGTVTVTNSTFSGNSDDAGRNGGGGLFNDRGTVTVTNSTFSGNSATGSATFGGGGLYNRGTVTVTNSTFSGNSATNFGSGGGLNNRGTATVTNSTFSGNSAHYGGGLSNPDGTVTVTNSTFSGNSAVDAGSGGGGLNNGGTATVTNSTFSGNSAPDAGGLYNSGGITVTNTVVGNNTGGNCSGSIINGGHNLDSGTTCGWGSTSGSLSNTHPLLGPLANNGGPTQTMALLPGSPAINAGDNAICAAPSVNGVDQRGVKRPQGKRCDIGAYEYVFPSGGGHYEFFNILRKP